MKHTPGPHIRIEAVLDLRTQDFSGKSHSAEFRCHACGKAQRQNRNFLGPNVLVCDGFKFHKINRSEWRDYLRYDEPLEHTVWRGEVGRAAIEKATGEQQ